MDRSDSFTASTEDISGLKAKIFCYSNRCKRLCSRIERHRVITQPDELVVALDGEPANVSCFGGNDGAITSELHMHGGTSTISGTALCSELEDSHSARMEQTSVRRKRISTGTYTYAWTGPDSFTASTEDISGLKAGTYAVTVTDANGCVAN